MLLSPRSQQSRLVLALLVRIVWQLECRDSGAVARLYLLYDAARVMLSRKLPWNEDQLAALVWLITSPSPAEELGKPVLRQVEFRGEPGEPVRRALKRLKAVGRFRREVHRLLGRPDRFSSLPGDRRMSLLVAHARRIPDEVSRRWWRKGKALLRQLGVEGVEQTLVPWLRDSLRDLHREHPRLLRGLVVLLGSVPSDVVVDLLEEVVKWGYRRRQGYGPLDLRLARSGIRALGRIGSARAVSFLVILGSELRYASASMELLSVLRKIAQKRRVSLHTLVERATGHGPFSSEGVAIEARVVGVAAEWSGMNARVKSEVLRDLGLFRSISSLEFGKAAEPETGRNTSRFHATKEL